MAAKAARCRCLPKHVILLIVGWLAGFGYCTHDGHNTSIHSALQDAPCMFDWQLDGTLPLAAITFTRSDGVDDTAVIISTCNIECMQSMLTPWLDSLKHARGLDLSRHAIVVAIGLPAYMYCEAARQNYRHYCVFDKHCVEEDMHRYRSKEEAEQEKQKDSAKTMGFGSWGWSWASNQRTVWVNHVLARNFSVLHLDMDIHVYQNPFPFFGSLPDGDMLISSEFCINWTYFEGDAHLHRPGEPFEQNTGVYYMRTSTRTIQFTKFWISYFHKGFRDGIHGFFDQWALNDIINNNVTEVIEVVYNNGAQQSENVLRREPDDLKVFRLALHKHPNACNGQCGCLPKNEGHIPVLPGNDSVLLLCDIEQSYLDQYITFHAACRSSLSEKLQALQIAKSMRSNRER